MEIKWKNPCIKRGLLRLKHLKMFLILTMHTCDELRYLLLETCLYSCMKFPVILNVGVCLILGFTKPDSLENGFFFFSLDGTYRGEIKGKNKSNKLCAQTSAMQHRGYILRISRLSPCSRCHESQTGSPDFKMLPHTRCEKKKKALAPHMNVANQEKSVPRSFMHIHCRGCRCSLPQPDITGRFSLLVCRRLK